MPDKPFMCPNLFTPDDPNDHLNPITQNPIANPTPVPIPARKAYKPRFTESIPPKPKEILIPPPLNPDKKLVELTPEQLDAWEKGEDINLSVPGKWEKGEDINLSVSARSAAQLAAQAAGITDLPPDPPDALDDQGIPVKSFHIPPDEGVRHVKPPKTEPQKPSVEPPGTNLTPPGKNLAPPETNLTPPPPPQPPPHKARPYQRKLDYLDLDAQGVTTEDICELISAGKFQTEICRMFKIPLHEFRSWIVRDPYRDASIRQASNTAGEVWDLAAESVILNVQTDSEFFTAEMQKAKELASHYRWRAAKISQTYKEKITVENTVKKIENLTNEQAIQEIAKLAKELNLGFELKIDAEDADFEEILNPGSQK